MVLPIVDIQNYPRHELDRA